MFFHLLINKECGTYILQTIVCLKFAPIIRCSCSKLLPFIIAVITIVFAIDRGRLSHYIIMPLILRFDNPPIAKKSKVKDSIIRDPQICRLEKPSYFRNNFVSIRCIRYNFRRNTCDGCASGQLLFKYGLTYVSSNTFPAPSIAENWTISSSPLYKPVVSTSNTIILLGFSARHH